MEIDRLTMDRNRYIERQQEVKPQREQPPAEQGQVRAGSASAGTVTAETPGTTGGVAAAEAKTQNAEAATVTRQTTSSDDDDSSYNSIVAKVNSGQQLSSSELDVLRSRNPGLYAKAMQAKNAASELRTKMEENPAHAYREAQAAMRAVGQTAEQGGDLAVVHQALDAEYRSFAKQYDHIELSGHMSQMQAALGAEEKG